MVKSKFTEHLDGHALLTYNAKSVSLEDILREEDWRGWSFDTEPSSTSGDEESDASSSPMTLSSVTEREGMMERPAALRADTLPDSGTHVSLPGKEGKKVKLRRWTSPFGKSNKS